MIWDICNFVLRISGLILLFIPVLRILYIGFSNGELIEYHQAHRTQQMIIVRTGIVSYCVNKDSQSKISDTIYLCSDGYSDQLEAVIIKNISEKEVYGIYLLNLRDWFHVRTK